MLFVIVFNKIIIMNCSSDMGSNSSDSDGPPIHMQYQAERVSIA